MVYLPHTCFWKYSFVSTCTSWNLQCLCIFSYFNDKNWIVLTKCLSLKALNISIFPFTEKKLSNFQIIKAMMEIDSYVDFGTIILLVKFSLLLRYCDFIPRILSILMIFCDLNILFFFKSFASESVFIWLFIFKCAFNHLGLIDESLKYYLCLIRDFKVLAQILHFYTLSIFWCNDFFQSFY